MTYESSWSDDRLRAFLTTVYTAGSVRNVSEDEREAFIREARRRIAPAVGRRLLADLGVTTDPDGLARIAFEIIGEGVGRTRGTWLMVASDPFDYCVEMVFATVRVAFRDTVGLASAGDDERLAGIAAASG